LQALAYGALAIYIQIDFYIYTNRFLHLCSIYIEREMLYIFLSIYVELYIYRERDAPYICLYIYRAYSIYRERYAASDCVTQRYIERTLYIESTLYIERDMIYIQREREL